METPKSYHGQGLSSIRTDASVWFSPANTSGASLQRIAQLEYLNARQHSHNAAAGNGTLNTLVAACCDSEVVAADVQREKLWLQFAGGHGSIMRPACFLRAGITVTTAVHLRPRVPPQQATGNTRERCNAQHAHQRGLVAVVVLVLQLATAVSSIILLRLKSDTYM